ncbi:hypothetical protein O0I10_009566 [Lichtheimia ornata]|uniref:Major facilitator superfamily (MFS) profile domain-containing protein n=1 Tax=Lichtheimia ornata TaxID=688661 RepID=A0AAD7UY55_9FUNG|nr:uncharacterized protein O0I10_009566 [Lichtheimia ornata]KAJ8654842.1 hypothetical protein O0I10_009566 [Lichtheimia ornata]
MTQSNTHNRSEDLGFPKYMTFCAVIAAISGFNVGWHISVPNMPEELITKCTEGTDPISGLPACLPMEGQTCYTIGAFALGGLFGSLATMFTNRIFGRRDNIMISCGWFIAGGLLSSVSINIGMYSVGRAFVGIGAGMCGSSVAIYVSEVSTKKSRGALGSLFECFLNLGILLTQVCGLYMSYGSVWRLLWAIPSFIAAIQLVAILFLTVECPRRLCAMQQYDKARDALQRLRGDADIENEFQMLIDARQREIESGTKMMSIIEVLMCKSRRVSWLTLIVCVVQAYNQVGGVGPMSVYSVGFFTDTFNGDNDLATKISLANATGNCVATFIALATMHKVGRKGWMLISLLGQTIASVFIVIASTLGNLPGLVITGAILFTFTYSTGCGVIPWLIAPELLPLYALPAGSALGNASNWATNFIINTCWPSMNAAMGTYSFTFFAGVNAFGFLFVLFFMPETTGKDLDHHDDKNGSTADSEHDVDHKSIEHHVDHVEVSK